MSWIDTILNFLFPPPVPVSTFAQLPRPLAHEHYPWIFPATRYTGDAQKIAKYLKKTPDAIYLQACARMMAFQIEAYLIEQSLFQSTALYLVPVPQHASRTRERGFNQSALLAHHIQQLLPYTSIQNMLEKTRSTEKQALLPRELRVRNQQHAFACTTTADTLEKQSLVIIVDDIATTGSTLVACKAALEERGFTNVIGLVFAH